LNIVVEAPVFLSNDQLHQLHHISFLHKDRAAGIGNERLFFCFAPSTISFDQAWEKSCLLQKRTDGLLFCIVINLRLSCFLIPATIL
jgi:hypothetical protein